MQENIQKKWYLVHKDGSRQEVEYVYGSFSEEGGFVEKRLDENEKEYLYYPPPVKYDEPMVVVRLLEVDIEKPWSFKTVKEKFVIYA